MPLITLLSIKPPPMIFTTRMLSTLNCVGFLGRTINIASATRGARISSFPNCFEPITVRTALVNSSTLLMSLILSTTNSGFVSRRSPGVIKEYLPSKAFKAKFIAFSYPLAISEGWRPNRNRSSANFKSSPAKIMTKFVASPICIQSVSTVR
jgi:hypothetical protein